MLGTLQKLGEHCQSSFNAGFLTHLYLIRTEEIVYNFFPQGESVSQPLGAIGIQAGAVITQILLRPKTATFSESSSENENGIAYGFSLSVPVKGTSPEITNWVHQNGKRRYALLTRDTLGNCYMIGSLENGARVTWSRQVGSQTGHQLSISHISWYPAQLIPMIDIEQMFPDREFDYSFDISFS